MELRGRVGLVTGSGRRVGRALAEALGAQGMRVAVHYHGSASGAEETVQAIRDAGSDARAFRADLRDPAECERLVGDVVSRFGGLDVLVNSAAIMERTPFGDTSAEQWDEIFALNLRAPFFCAQAAAPHLRQARGAIINIADLGGLEVWPGYIPHGISKAGVVHLTRSLARVMAPEVRVNAIAPGTVLLPDDWDGEASERLRRTTPLATHGSPDDVVGAMLYLLTAGFVTGDTVIVDGGRHLR